jgi:hypothetical protein
MNLTSSFYMRTFAASPHFGMDESKKQESKSIWTKKSFAQVVSQNILSSQSDQKDSINLRRESTTSLSLQKSPKFVSNLSWFKDEIESADTDIKNQEYTKAQNTLDTLKSRIPALDLLAHAERCVAYANTYPKPEDLDRRLELRKEAYNFVRQIKDKNLQKKQLKEWIFPVLVPTYLDKAGLLEKEENGLSKARKMIEPLLMQEPNLASAQYLPIKKRMIHLYVGIGKALVKEVEENNQMNKTTKKQKLAEAKNLLRKITEDTEFRYDASGKQFGLASGELQKIERLLQELSRPNKRK